MNLKSHNFVVATILLVSALFLISVVSVNMPGYSNQAQVAKNSPVTIAFNNTPYAGTSGAPINISVTVTLPSNGSVTGVDKITLNYGGKSSVGAPSSVSSTAGPFSGLSKTFTYSYSYLKAGTYTITFSLTDANGGRKSLTTTTTISSVSSPIVSLNSQNYTALVGQPLSFTGTIQAPGTGNRLKSYSVLYGDGQSRTVTTRETSITFQDSHTYSASGNYSLILKATDYFDSTKQATAQVSITAPFTSCQTVYLIPGQLDHASYAGVGTVIVKTPNNENCRWSASSDSDWLTFTTPSSGSGEGYVGYAITANPNKARVGHILANGGATYTVNQAGDIVEPPPPPPVISTFGLEEELRWIINRGRFNTAAENTARGTAYPLIASMGPLAPNPFLTLAAQHHSEDMAKANLVQHTTLPTSLYYNPTTQPNPWDRVRAEGYIWNYMGENIAGGYTNATTLYLGWLRSDGHRANLYSNNYREIGSGFYNNNQTTPYYFHTMDVGAYQTNSFFTDTLFFDQDSNGAYQPNEAKQDIRIQLQVAGVPVGTDSISTDVGSFYIPITSIAANSVVKVVLTNPTASDVTLSIPLNYHNYATVTIPAGGSKEYGTFVKPIGGRNFGFRDLTPL